MSTITTPQKPFPIFVPDGHRGERSNPPPSPNHHPYAIKTTSTAVLTRSNSSGYGVYTRHNYVPTSPSPSSKHRYSKSDVTDRQRVEPLALNVSPRPLPTPPSLGSPTKTDRELRGGYASSEDLRFPSWRTHRADTLPSSTPPPSSPVKVDDLPSNPKLWTSKQLASYLITALRVRSGESLPIPLAVAKDIAAFVKDAHLNGRSFLRLNEQDLESMGINNLWREALLNASRHLRQNVVRGRIWGIDADEHDGDVFMSPFRHAMYNSSSSSVDDIPVSLETTPSKSRIHGTRVRGLVANLERSSSSGSGSGFSVTGEGDAYALAGAWADDEGAFASGSEASEAESERIGSITKRPLPVEPVTPPVELLQEIPGEVEVVAGEAEPTVQDLLVSNGGLSRSWGAQAWEEIDSTAGETVKRIVPQNELEDVNVPVLMPTLTGTTFSRGSGRGNRKSIGNDNNARMPIKDIFSRPLPTPPKPVNATGSEGSALINGPVASPSGPVKLDQCLQTDVEAEVTSETCEQSQQTDDSTDSEVENLRIAISLVESVRARLAEVEMKLAELERQNVDPPVSEHSCQSIQTEDADKEPSLLMESNSIPACQVGDEVSLTSMPPSVALINVEEDEKPAGAMGEWNDMLNPNGEWDVLENGLTSYVLMVGVGVCAVVLSTIFKRLAGRRS